MRELERLRRENARLNERKEKQGQSESKNSAQKENEKLRQKIARLEKEKQQSKPKVVAKRQPKPQKSLPASTTTGSGFFVSRLGHILTNEHVVSQCRSVSVGDNANKQPYGFASAYSSGTGSVAVVTGSTTIAAGTRIGPFCRIRSSFLMEDVQVEILWPPILVFSSRIVRRMCSMHHWANVHYIFHKFISFLKNNLVGYEKISLSLT